MITPEVKIQLKEFLKSNYTEEVLKILADKEIVNREGENYSASMVKNVLNGHQENLEIEKVLTIVYHRRKKAYNKHQDKLRSLVKK